MEVCREYEEAWERGERPTLSFFAEGFSDDDREMVLSELRRVQSELELELATGSGAAESGGGRFRVCEFLARGGMGQVSIARDVVFQRDVALKEIRGGSADDHRYRARFLREAEITAQLEHPGVIPVYSRGEHADGRPYYVMRLIRGDQTGTFQDAISHLHDVKRTSPGEFPAEQRRLVRRLVDVCNTMAYAHSRGVIHRDLKPSNILLGAFGETLVVDWGLAYRADPEELGATWVCESVAASIPGTSGIGTPGYSPPEQLVQSGAAVTTAADIYSLGAVLYCLLTGRPPFLSVEGAPEELVSRIVSGDFAVPRLLNSAASPALEAICLKAMRRNPEQRYQSAAEFAAELERWLSDNPVLAWPEPMLMRVRRLFFRHRMAVSVGMVALLMSVVGLSGWLVIQSRHTLELQRRQASLVAANRTAEAERDAAEVERTRAERQRVLAEAERRRAESRESLALEALDNFRESIAREPLLKESGNLTALRERLLREPLRFYSAFQSQFEESADASPRSIQQFAQSAIGLAGQHEALGDSAEAAALLDRVIPLLRSLGARTELASDERFESQQYLARALRNRGILSFRLRKVSEAEPLLREAVEVYGGIRASCPPEKSLRHDSDLADAYSSLGAVLAVRGQKEESAEAMREAIRVLEGVSEAAGERTVYLLQLGDIHSNLGVSLAGLRQLEEAEAEYAAATAIFLELEKRSGAVRDVRHRLAAVRFNRAKLLEYRGLRDEAIAEHLSVLELRRQLHLSYPSFQDYRQTVFSSREVVVELLLQADRGEEALEIIQQWAADARQVSDLSGGHLDHRIQLLDALHSTGHLHSRLNRAAEAEPWYREALALHRELLPNFPGDPLRMRTQAELLEHVAKFDLSRGRFADVRSALEEAIPLQRSWMEHPEVRPLDRAFLRQMYEMLAQACEGLGDMKATEAAQGELEKLK
jgi:serine/threonine-protein kinase